LYKLYLTKQISAVIEEMLMIADFYSLFNMYGMTFLQSNVCGSILIKNTFFNLSSFSSWKFLYDQQPTLFISIDISKSLNLSSNLSKNPFVALLEKSPNTVFTFIPDYSSSYLASAIFALSKSIIIILIF